MSDETVLKLPHVYSCMDNMDEPLGEYEAGFLLL